jgi:hypothetical protein
VAFTVTNYSGSIADGSATTSASTGAFTPSAGGILIYWYRTAEEADLTTIAGHGDNWTKVAHRDSGTTAKRIEAQWTADHSAVSDTVDVTWTSRAYHHGVIQVTGDVDTTTPITQTAGNDSYIDAPPESLTVTYGAGFTTGNLSLCLYGKTSSAGEINTTGSFAELFEVNVSLR